MKKLIAIAVVLALVAGAAFAVDVGGTVIGSVNLLENGKDEAGDDVVKGSGQISRLRFDGGGEAGEGKFGGFARVELGDWANDPLSPVKFIGLAWWKPIDQFKLTFGGNPDGFYGKEGVTGWMFQQMVSDTNVGSCNGDNVWGWGASNPGFVVTRQAFFGGFDGNGLMLDIKPIDMLGINLVLPYMAGGTMEDIFKGLIAQVDLNFDFGNIAISYKGGAPGGYVYGNSWGMWGDGAGQIFAYFGLTAIENVGLDVGFSFVLPDENEFKFPIAAGLGAKIGISDQFGIKARTTAAFGGDDKAFNLLFDILPYFTFSDSLRAFFAAGIIMNSPDEGDSTLGWHINPYLEIGNEWGPCFYIGIKAFQVGDADLNWSIPMGIAVSF